MNIQLITQSEIKQEYKKIFKDAQIIKGSVAYWTFDSDFIDQEFGKNI